MIKKLLYKFRQKLLRVPILRTVIINRQFRTERKIIRGRHQSNSSHPSIIHFSVNKAATQYIKGILFRCAVENKMTPVGINEYAFESNFPYPDSIPEKEMIKYQYLFKPLGYLYSVFGSMVDGIQNMNKYLIVLIIRDPRDVLTSNYFSAAFSHRKPSGRNKIETFMNRRAYARKVGIDRFVKSESNIFLEVYQRYLHLINSNSNVYLSKYEEMIFNFPLWLNKLLQFCELPISPQLHKKLIHEAFQSQRTEENYLKHTRQVLPGDYERKLQPETILYINSKFSDILMEFNYT